MTNIEAETTVATTTELLDNAISGIQNKLSKLRIAAFQEQSRNPTKANRITAVADHVLVSLNQLKSIRETQ